MGGGCDGKAKQQVSVTIHGTNDVPTIGGVATVYVTRKVNQTTSKRACSAAVSSSDLDQGQSSFIAQASHAGTYGTFTLAANGAWTYAASDSQVAIQDRKSVV